MPLLLAAALSLMMSVSACDNAASSPTSPDTPGETPATEEVSEAPVAEAADAPGFATIQSIVENNNHCVVGIARTHTEAVALARETKPGLILADIQLADNSSGIDAVKEILQDMDVPVIFITAYPERLLTGERPEPTYLITKPFMPETVSATMAQALFFSEGLTQEAQLA